MPVEVQHGFEGADNENLNSLVLKLTYGDTTMLLGGDCETNGCERDFDSEAIDVYKVRSRSPLRPRSEKSWLNQESISGTPPATRRAHKARGGGRDSGLGGGSLPPPVSKAGVVVRACWPER